MTSFQAGQYVLLSPNYTVPVKIRNADRHRISYECQDGVTEAVEETAFRSLDDLTSEWRHASPEQIARFEELHSPAPHNYL
ncbi:hypothetical protein [Streptomyces smyrnaeus]|uniref:hypothetical protein n=1 Tax=Streptomyces smyrnaeus TaxID=1387713 RepID=UPI000C194451